MDEQLELLKEGNEQAFEEFVIKYKDEATKFAVSILKDYHTAEDIVQDSFATFLYIEKGLKAIILQKLTCFLLFTTKQLIILERIKEM